MLIDKKKYDLIYDRVWLLFTFRFLHTKYFFIFFLCRGNYIGCLKPFAGFLRGDTENGEPHSNVKSSTTGPWGCDISMRRTHTYIFVYIIHLYIFTIQTLMRIPYLYNLRNMLERIIGYFSTMNIFNRL